MTWGKVDDKAHTHPKFEAAGLEAIGLWTVALSYACDQLTDGYVTAARAGCLAGGGDTADRLALKLCRAPVGFTAGLWHLAEDRCTSPACDALRKPKGTPGWRFHDWGDYQPLRADVEAARMADAARKRRKRPTNVQPDSARIPAGLRSESGQRPPGSRDGTGSGSDLGSDLGSGARPAPPDGLADPADEILGELERHPVFGDLATAEQAQALSLVAFHAKRRPGESRVCVAEAAAKEGPRAAAEGPRSIGALATFVGACIRSGPRGGPHVARAGYGRPAPGTILPNGTKVLKGGHTGQVNADSEQGRKLAAYAAECRAEDEEAARAAAGKG